MEITPNRASEIAGFQLDQAEEEPRQTRAQLREPFVSTLRVYREPIKLYESIRLQNWLSSKKAMSYFCAAIARTSARPCYGVRLDFSSFRVLASR